MARDASPSPTIHLAYPGIEQLVDISAIHSVAPEAEIVVSSYFDPTELRTAKRLNPKGPQREDLIPKLSAEQLAAFGKAEIVLALDVPLALDEIAPNLRWIQAVGSGTGQFASVDLEGSGITLTSAAGVSAGPIAEFVMGRVLMVWKRFRELEDLQAAHNWTPTLGRTVAGSTMGIVGLGAIGSELAVRAKAFGMQVLAVRRRADLGATPGVDEIHGPEGVDDIASRCDVLALCTPATSETENLLDERLLALMKPGAVVCNVGRGNLVDEAALIASLETGHTGAALLDVAREEPLPSDNPLWTAPNVYISPHSSAADDRYFGLLFELFLDNLSRYLSGTELRNLVEMSRGY